MDPQAITNNATTPFNFTEIWPYKLGQGLGQLTEISNREEDDPMIGDRKTEERKRRQIDDASANATSDNDISKRAKAASSKSKCSRGGEKGEGKVEMEGGKKDYIHVRARRGQATDSHSLAERARREKISERMKILQDLVPGCNKVIGKALVLDEIINYIQSLQQQVEFLSMKLEAVNSRTAPSTEGFPSKNLQYGQQAFEMVGVTFDSQAPREFNRSSSPEWLHMQIGGNPGDSHGLDTRVHVICVGRTGSFVF